MIKKKQWVGCIRFLTIMFKLKPPFITVHFVDLGYFLSINLTQKLSRTFAPIATALLLLMLFIRHACATSCILSACPKSKLNKI